MSEADIGESNADQNGKCRYCGMDLAHCICGKTRGESCAVGCGDDGCTFAASHAYETEREHALERREILVLAAGAALLAASFFFAGTAQIALRIASYLTAGGGVLLKTVKGVRRGRFFDENALMSIATVGAICLGDFAEAAAVMVFYGVGEGLQEAAVRRSRKRISDAVALHPDRARRVTDGLQESVPPEEVAVGETILVRTGERVPLDGEVLEGSSLLDVSMLTGEPRPVRAARGDAVSAGSVSTTGPLTVRVTRPAAESSTSRLLKAVEDAMRSKPSLERFITRFSRVYTPAMIGAAALLAVLPPLLGAGEWSDWIRRALIFLVISCPCALVLSIPLTFFAGLAVTSRLGLLFKGADSLERLPRVRAAVLDKTGTLTEGEFQVQRVESGAMEPGELLSLAAAAERDSLHPIAAAIVKADAGGRSAGNTTEIAGCGVTADVDGKRVAVGNRALMEREGALPDAEDGVFVAVGGTYAGRIVVGDRVRESAKAAVTALNRSVGYTAILTGDGAAAANEVGAALGVTEVFAALQPAEKLSAMREIRARIGETLFVGDGINDAPVLAGADIGVAVGLGGTDMAAEAADALLLTRDLTCLPRAVEASKKTVRTAKGNIAIALTIKAAALTLGVLGLAGMWAAVVADAGAALICVLHTLTLFGRTRAKE